jgi:hypothetical protein
MDDARDISVFTERVRTQRQRNSSDGHGPKEDMKLTQENHNARDATKLCKLLRTVKLCYQSQARKWFPG